jgi:hypothetical protein
MRFSLVTALVAGATLGKPPKFTYQSSHQMTGFRSRSSSSGRCQSPASYIHKLFPRYHYSCRCFGLAVPNSHRDGPVATLNNPAGPGKHRRPCHLRQKAVEISNAFRKVLGLPLLQTEKLADKGVAAASNDPTHHILPFVGTPASFVDHPHHHHKEHQETSWPSQIQT